MMDGVTASSRPFLDFRAMPRPPWGGPRELDVAGMADRGTPARCLAGIGPPPVICTITATRDASGTVTLTADLPGYEPVTEDGKLVGLRFPGCDQHPWHQR